ncbi:MAG: type IV toxin-antitoxin system AbiEi family antitoxin domain-containing protein [Solirubrobacteraceae bacterium]
MRYAQVQDGDSDADGIVRLARHQQGNLTVAQLHASGLTDSAIIHRCRSKRLFRVHHGVYSLGRPPSLPLERAAAAVLACGPGAALSHQSAFTLWGFASEWSFPLHVTSPTRRKHPGITTHEAPNLALADVRTQLGIRATSPARTLLDCAPELDERRLHRVAADARRAGLLHPAAIIDVTERFRTHPGTSRLRAVLTELRNPTRSEFEQAFLAFCRAHQLPTPLVNTQVAGHEVDAFFPEHRLIVELDGWDFHRDRHNFEEDRERDADALAAGLSTLRVTWGRMISRGTREAARLERILEAQRTG